MRLTLLSHSDQLTRLECEGEVTQFQFIPGQDPLQEVLGPNIFRRSTLLCLDKTTYVDSSGVSWLLSSHKQFERSGGKLVLHSIPPTVLQVLRLLKLTSLLNIAADEAEALQKLQGAKA